MRLRPPSPALVIACLALAVALSGGAYAVSTALPRNSVGPAQLKANAVNSAKVQNRSLRAADFGIGQIPKGPQGPAGAAGPQGPPGTSGVQQISSTGPSNSTGPKSFQVDCPSGKRAIGGGGTLHRHDHEHFPLDEPTVRCRHWLGCGRSRVEWRERRQLGRAGLGRLRDRRSLASPQGCSTACRSRYTPRSSRTCASSRAG